MAGEKGDKEKHSSSHGSPLWLAEFLERTMRSDRQRFPTTCSNCLHYRWRVKPQKTCTSYAAPQQGLRSNACSTTSTNRYPPASEHGRDEREWETCRRRLRIASRHCWMWWRPPNSIAPCVSGRSSYT